MFNLTLFLAAVLALLSTPAHAYLDAGTGSLIIQAVIGTIAGGLVAIRIYWQKIKDFFGRSASEQESDNNS